jgi:muramoyltetrapeptide carboxypeptidase LdcA involved in peptidoglycan recycling
MVELEKLHTGDRVAILSPSFAAPGKWPHVYEFGLQRLKDIFNLEPVEFPATKKLGATAEERTRDLVAAFEDKTIKAVISSLGGDDQITYIKNLTPDSFVKNPKPFFGYSDNTHFENFLWLNGIPSFYGGSLFVQFAEPGKMHDFTVKYLTHALFDHGEVELTASPEYSDIGLDWGNPETLNHHRPYESNAGWYWDATQNAEGLSWGGCVESIDELLRHGVSIPSLSDFENIILLAETSEEIPSSDYVRRVFRALGERGILKRIKGVLVGRPKAWEFDKQNDIDQKAAYRTEQRARILETVRHYNPDIPVVQNLDFGHSEPQICMPYGSSIRIDSHHHKLFANF